MKYPVYLPYIKTPDNGQELRYSLRSLSNIKNWNGEVGIVGDNEKWVKKVDHIRVPRITGKPYLDQVNKMLRACLISPVWFIASMDDLYITAPVDIKVYIKGELPTEGKGIHTTSKIATRQYLYDKGYPILDYECHAPMLVNTTKLIGVLELILKSGKNNLQWRSMYGNMYNVKGYLFVDKKTKDNTLRKGTIISTQHFTPELKDMFKTPSRFE